MNLPARLILFMAMIAFFLCAVTVFFSQGGKNCEEKQQDELPQGLSEKPVEKFIEEELFAAGEDSQAVYYMSRIRDAAGGKNWQFAKELFQAMKESCPNSVLLEEARIMLENEKKGNEDLCNGG